MRFKGTFSDRGVSLLEKRFLPAFEKIGRNCHVYFTPEHLILIHNVLSTEGVQAIAQFSKDAIFNEYSVTSQNENCIAVQVDLGLFLRALKSSISMDGEVLQMKLVKKRAGNGGPAERPMPFLTLESKGFRSAVVQDVPISNPLSRAEVRDLRSVLNASQGLPATLVQLPEIVQLQTLVERLKNVGEVLDIAVSQLGDLYLRVATSFVSIGAEYRSLRVLGRRVDAATRPSEENAPPSVRMQRAVERQEASAVKVSVKHFARSLHCHLSKPDASFCGVAPNDACLLMMFQYFIPGTRQTDDSVSLHYRLPVLDQ